MLEEIEKGEKILQWLEEWSLWVYEASKKHILNIIDCYGITWACTHPNGWWITRNTKQISKKFHFINSLQEENNWKVKREGSWGYYECSHAHKLWTKGEGSVQRSLWNTVSWYNLLQYQRGEALIPIKNILPSYIGRGFLQCQ